MWLMCFTEVLFFFLIPLHRDALVSFWHEFKNVVAVGMELPCTQPFTNRNFHFLIIAKTATSQMFRQSKQNNSMTGNIRTIGCIVHKLLVKQVQQFLYPTYRMVTTRNRFDVHGTVHRKSILPRITNKMQRYTIFFIAVNALHVSGGFPPIIRSSKFKTVHTASGMC
jgi:hypothetical protein